MIKKTNNNLDDSRTDPVHEKSILIESINKKQSIDFRMNPDYESIILDQGEFVTFVLRIPHERCMKYDSTRCFFYFGVMSEIRPQMCIMYRFVLRHICSQSPIYSKISNEIHKQMAFKIHFFLFLSSDVSPLHNSNVVNSNTCTSVSNTQSVTTFGELLLDELAHTDTHAHTFIYLNACCKMSHTFFLFGQKSRCSAISTSNWRRQTQTPTITIRKRHNV